MTGRLPLVMSLCLTALSANAQLSGTVDDPAWGLSFQIPGGWLAQRIDAGYLLRSETQAGFILLTSHQYRSMQELQSESVRGVQDGNGTELMPTGSATRFGGNGLKAEYAGTLEETAARAVAIALLSPQGGGVTILVAAQEESFGPAHHRLAESVARSVSFRKPSAGPMLGQWRRRLSGTRLTTMSSYTSGTSGGYSMQSVIHLCPNGKFLMERTSSVSMDVPGASGSSVGQGGGRGIWDVVLLAGTAVLELRFEDGSTAQYSLTMPQNTLHLSGARYYQTNDPACP